MRIMHVNLVMGYTEGLGYQENCVSRCHAEDGHQVTMLTTRYCYTDGVWGRCPTSYDYDNDYGMHVIRLPFLLPLPYAVNRRIGLFRGTWQVIDQERPEVICIHNHQFLDVLAFARYRRRHPEVRILIDSHADHTNCARNLLSEHVLHRRIWKACTQAIAPCAERFYGVTPSRLDFMVDVYGIDRDQCELLMMGAEDDLVRLARMTGVRERIRTQYGIGEEDFLIVTGGKINHWRSETLHLMEAVAAIGQTNVHLLIFGNVAEELRSRFDELLQSPNITFAGWQDALATYEIMGAADLVVFPGLHSVMWEQAVGLGVPCVFRDIDGFHHVDLGGNAILLKDVSTESLRRTVQELVDNPDRCAEMRRVAETKGMQTFSYREISRRSIRE